MIKNDDSSRKSSEELFSKLRETGMTLAFAESITAGNLSAEIVKYPGASDVLLGGITAYANSVKTGLLGVEEETLENHGAVSEQTVRDMVRGLHKRIPADVCAAISGIAGPGGGSAEKPVGTVWLAVSGPAGTIAFNKIFSGSRDEIILACVEWVYNTVLELVD